METKGDRGTGRTTALLKNAPQGAYFVWCNEHVEYPERLARLLGRLDIQVKPLGWLHKAAGPGGCGTTPVVIDHAVGTTRAVVQALMQIEAYSGRAGSRHEVDALVCRRCGYTESVRRADPTPRLVCPKGTFCNFVPQGYNSDPATPRCMCSENKLEKIRWRPEMGTRGIWACYDCLPRNAYERIEQRTGRKFSYGESYESVIIDVLDKLETFERAEANGPSEEARAKDAVDELALCLFASERRNLIDRRTENAKGDAKEIARVVEIAWRVELTDAQREGYLARAEAVVHVALVLRKADR